jgi:hypothetical protein
MYKIKIVMKEGDVCTFTVSPETLNKFQNWMLKSFADDAGIFMFNNGFVRLEQIQVATWKPELDPTEEIIGYSTTFHCEDEVVH